MTLRVVSLVPSVTETLLAWGVPPVAVTRFCEQPGFRTVGGTKDPDVAAIVALAPDLVVLNDEENRREDADALEAAGVATHTVVIRSVDDVGPELERLAGAVGVPPPNDWHLAEPRPVTQSAFVPIWRRPWMTLNDQTYGASLLRHLGIANVFGDDEDRYPETTLDAARDRKPDIVIAPSEPYPFADRHVVELERVAPVALVDGRDLFWWGIRTQNATTGARLLRPGPRCGD